MNDQSVGPFARPGAASPEASYLLKKIKGSERITGKIMPPPGKAALSGYEIALVENWIMGLKEGRPARPFTRAGTRRPIS